MTLVDTHSELKKFKSEIEKVAKQFDLKNLESEMEKEKENPSEKKEKETEKKPSYIQRGRFIVIEGTDRAGKTTQCQKLAQYYAKQDIMTEFYSFPERTTHIGAAIDKYLKKQLALPARVVSALFTANRFELKDKIERSLNQGITIIVDRYIMSGVAMSMSKGMDRDFCLEQEMGLPSPDITFYLRVPISQSMKREGFGQELYETAEFQNKAQIAFDQLFDLDSELSDKKDLNMTRQPLDRGPTPVTSLLGTLTIPNLLSGRDKLIQQMKMQLFTGRVVKLDASQSIEKVHEAIVGHLE